MQTLEKDKANKFSILNLAEEKRQTVIRSYFEFFSICSSRMKSNLPSWLLETIRLIPANSLIRDFEKEYGYDYFWEDFLNTLFLRSSQENISFNTNTRVQVTPFGLHFGVGLDDKILFEATFDLFYEMVGKKLIFTEEEGYLVISFEDEKTEEI